ncbi:MAG TPA: hypothetical protein VF755_19165, partial [Catenuloplanes sp.]
ASQCSVSVFVTAGNGEPTVRNRQAGIKDAYRVMAQVADLPNQAEWDPDPVTIAGYPVEQFLLRDRPTVKLAFVNLDDPLGSTGRPGVSKLWNNTAASVSVIDPDTDQPTQTAPTTISRSGVLDVLSGLMGAYLPTTLRIQDTVPDSRYMTDHADHIATALFAQDAAHSYRVATGVAMNVVYYRDYNISSSPSNLDAGNRADKDQRFYGEYVRLNPTAQIDANGYYWTHRTYYRWARGTSWAGRNADGRLAAFIVRDGEAFAHTEQVDGSWTGPVSLGRPGQGLYPAVSVSYHADGRMALFARGLDGKIMAASQTVANGGWSAWADLGSPNLGLSNASQVGTPAVAIGANGRMQVFVKNGAGGLSSRAQTAASGSTWGAWTNLGGTGLHDPVVAATNRGLIEVFASTTTTVKRWRQTTSNGTVAADLNFVAGKPAGPPSIAVNQDGRLEVQYRAAGTNTAAATRDLEVVVQNTPGGSWRTTRLRIGTKGGIGESRPITTGLTTSDSRILALTRTRTGGFSVIRQTAANAGYGASEDLGGIFVDYAAAAKDRANLVTVFGVGIDGGLWINRQTAAGGAAGFAGWVRG